MEKRRRLDYIQCIDAGKTNSQRLHRLKGCEVLLGKRKTRIRDCVEYLYKDAPRLEAVPVETGTAAAFSPGELRFCDRAAGSVCLIPRASVCVSVRVRAHAYRHRIGEGARGKVTPPPFSQQGHRFTPCDHLPALRKQKNVFTHACACACAWCVLRATRTHLLSPTFSYVNIFETFNEHKRDSAARAFVFRLDNSRKFPTSVDVCQHSSLLELEVHRFLAILVFPPALLGLPAVSSIHLEAPRESLKHRPAAPAIRRAVAHSENWAKPNKNTDDTSTFTPTQLALTLWLNDFSLRIWEGELNIRTVEGMLETTAWRHQWGVVVAEAPYSAPSSVLGADGRLTCSPPWLMLKVLPGRYQSLVLERQPDVERRRCTLLSRITRFIVQLNMTVDARTYPSAVSSRSTCQTTKDTAPCDAGLYRARCLIFSAPFTGWWTVLLQLSFASGRRKEQAFEGYLVTELICEILAARSSYGRCAGQLRALLSWASVRPLADRMCEFSPRGWSVVPASVANRLTVSAIRARKVWPPCPCLQIGNLLATHLVALHTNNSTVQPWWYATHPTMDDFVGGRCTQWISSMEYTIEEYCDMYRTFCECRGNANVAARLYRERYRGHRHPIANVIRRLDQRARESGQIMPGISSSDVRKESHLELVAGRRLGVSYSLVLTILHDDGLYPYCYNAIHPLIERDRPRHFKYCQGMLTSLQHNPDFVGHIRWTDEAQFTREGISNWHNSHHWHQSNPHRHSLDGTMQCFSARFYRSCWKTFHWPFEELCGTNMTGYHLITAEQRAGNLITPLRSGGSDQGRTSILTTKVTRPRSRKLFLRGFLKELMYHEPVASVEECIARLHAAVVHVTNDYLRAAQAAIPQRVRACIVMEGEFSVARSNADTTPAANGGMTTAEVCIDYCGLLSAQISSRNITGPSNKEIFCTALLKTLSFSVQKRADKYASRDTWRYSVMFERIGIRGLDNLTATETIIILLTVGKKASFRLGIVRSRNPRLIARACYASVDAWETGNDETCSEPDESYSLKTPVTTSCKVSGAETVDSDEGRRGRADTKLLDAESIRLFGVAFQASVHASKHGKRSPQKCLTSARISATTAYH
ncbi:hypothetical protein PR048_019280 [Dryococelus australis]|uniref:DUF4817 domain-containing protein n=1 Tax=Dryococelus australis TaxID=614101 RepID=A0ABQ9H348_9NEOP|nr:hypothetical protein PR048_019280 [Dryococelus australis]